MPTHKIRSFADLDHMCGKVNHVLTLFSGGLDSSYVLKELAQRGFSVTALAVDVGEACKVEDLDEITRFFGVNLKIVDAKEMFAREAVAPAICAQARYLGSYPVSSSLSRPILAKVAVMAAQELGCEAIVHTANQSQNSLRRLNGAIEQLGFQGCYGTPYERSVLSRNEKIQVLRQLGLNRFQARGISGDANLWCREFESGSLDNPEGFWAPPSLFDWTRSSDNALPDRDIRISFYEGCPIAIDGAHLTLVPLIQHLNHHVGAYQIGRYSGLEHLAGGEKVLEVREAPAACILMDAYRHLETAVLEAELLREKLGMEQLWTREAVEGRWYGTLRQCADAFIQQTSKKVTGTVAYNLRPGAMDVCSIVASSGALYLKDRDQWEKTIVDESFAVPFRSEVQDQREGIFV